MGGCQLTLTSKVRIGTSRLGASFPFLSCVLRQDSAHGLVIHGHTLPRTHVDGRQGCRLLSYYSDAATVEAMEQNLAWAKGETSRPRFKFAYLMLPTSCNQACPGCFMGQDKDIAPPHLSGPHFSPSELQGLLSFLCEHGAEAVVYGGGGELFTWSGAFEFLEAVKKSGLRPVVFTNGTLLSQPDVARLNGLGTSLIISMRDTVEAWHNRAVGRDGFRRTLLAIEYALQEGFHLESRLAVEIPVTKENETRVLDEFLPAMRHVGIVPMAEEYIQISASSDERGRCHTFTETRSFFERARAKDAEVGIHWELSFGQRIIGEPKCSRPLYSFAVFPSRDVFDCPSHSVCYGNLQSRSLYDVLYSDRFRQALLGFTFCACSPFYTASDESIPLQLPCYLRALK